MAKKRAADPNQSPNGNKAGKGDGGETVAGYFRKVFHEKPSLFAERSNDKLLQRWLADHPDQTEVPKNVKSSLSNIKSILRSKKRSRVAKKAEKQTAGQEGHGFVATVPTGATALENLEHQIDECLTLAKNLDRKGLESVISHLRRARNEVVWKIGQ